MGHQSENSVVRRWQTNFDARMDWAFDAYGRLVASLSSDVRSSMASAHPEAYVVVFGRTQVGKTTLLLELMGVNAPSVDRVSAVLRGGRVKGQSATATAMEYGRSADESWSLQVPNQPPERFAEDSQVCSALGALRHRMEAQQLNLDGPVRLDIPCDCFVPVDEGHARVRMLDLPGDQASNPVEQKHVEQIAERFVAGADLILLVGKMDDLSFLKPGGLLLPGIEDWQIVPDRFRIITTYSFTAGSVQAAVRKRGLRIEQIRSRLIDQLETFGTLSLEARRADLFFPLEFGQSIERAAHHDPDLVSQIKPLVDELKAELAHQINSSTTPMARLRTALGSHLTVAKVKAQRLAVMAKEAQRLNDCLASARADLEAAQRAALANVKRHERLNFRQDQIVRHNPKARIPAICALDEAELVSAVAGSAKSVKCLQSCLDEFRSWMRESYLALDTSCDSASADLAWFWRGVRLPLEDDLHEVRRLLDEHLGAIESHLNQYWIDRYVIESTFQRDVVSVQEAIKEAANACRALAKRRWRSAVERQIKAHTRTCEESLNEVLLDEKLLRDLGAKVESESDAVTHFDRQCRDFESRMTGDLERCRAFTEILDECYERQLVTMIDRMRCVNDPSYALVELISCVQLIETRSHLLTTASPHIHIEAMSVEQHEIELKELLARVMRDPLQPLQAQLDQTGANLTQMDQQLKALRDVELGGVCARLDGVEKSLKRLCSWSEDDAANEFKNAVLPPVQQVLNTLGTRIDTQFAAITQPVAGMSYEIAQTASAVERLAEQSAQSSALAGQRVASLGEQVRDLTTLQVEQSHSTQTKVKGAIDEAVEHLNAKTALANAEHEANLKRLVDEEVSRRIDKLMILGRWAVGIGIAALSAATAGLYLYIRGLP